jgi:nucleotide-binding universal stress UspA family protein
MKTILMCHAERPVADAVIERTAMLAEKFGAKVYVASVAPVLHSRGGPIDPVDPPSAHEQEAGDVAARLAEHGVKAKPLVAIGDPADAIVHLADEHDVDLIVVGAHDGGAVSRFIRGAVGEEVARKAHADVLIVH